MKIAFYRNARLLLYAAVVAGLTSCTRDEVPLRQGEAPTVTSRSAKQVTEKNLDAFLVPEQTAVALARRTEPGGRFFHPSAAQKERTISAVHTIKDDTGLPCLFIINYETDGFAVISADYRYSPLCASVEKGKYEQTAVPSGLIDWLDATLQQIRAIRSGTITPDKEGWRAWQLALEETGQDPVLTGTACCPICPNYPACLTTPSLGCGDPDIWCGQGGDGNNSGQNPDEDDACGPFTTHVKGPLLTTSWGQSCTYNEQCPLLGCSACYSNTRAYTGCVATAIAQVLRYWEHPNPFLYQYYTMPNDHGDREVQRMMRDAGNSVQMNYGCSSSGASGAGIPRSFTQTFSFGSAGRKNFQPADLQLIMHNIDTEKPVILDGCQQLKKVFGVFTVYDNCHAWVCDGYQINQNKCVHNIKLHMNWGWDGYYNGWFHYQTWSGPGVGFPYSQNLTYNIEP